MPQENILWMPKEQTDPIEKNRWLNISFSSGGGSVNYLPFTLQGKH